MRLATAPPHHRTTAPLAGVLLFLIVAIYSLEQFNPLLIVVGNQWIRLIASVVKEALGELMLWHDKRFQPVTTHE